MSGAATDRELVTAAQAGDGAAFGLLVGKYQRKLARLLARYVRDPAEVEDLTQETFIKAHQALPSFRGDSAFYTWLYRIGANTAKNFLVTAGRRMPNSTDLSPEDMENREDGDLLQDNATPESLLLAKEIAQTVETAISALPAELREAIRLRELEGRHYDDIAVILGCSVGTVRSRLWRAREVVAAALAPLLDLPKGRRW